VLVIVALNLTGNIPTLVTFELINLIRLEPIKVHIKRIMRITKYSLET
jgi:hypothetical protein